MLPFCKISKILFKSLHDMYQEIPAVKYKVFKANVTSFYFHSFPLSCDILWGVRRGTIFTPGRDWHEQWTSGWCLGNAAAISSRPKCQQQAATQYLHIPALIPVGNVIGLRHLKNNTREYRATKMHWLDLTCNRGHACFLLPCKMLQYDGTLIIAAMSKFSIKERHISAWFVCVLHRD